MGFFVKLFFDFNEDAHAFLALGFGISNFCEGFTEFETEIGQILADLQGLIKRNNFMLVINLDSNQSFAIALMHKLFDLSPSAKKAQMFSKSLKVKIGIEILAFL